MDSITLAVYHQSSVENGVACKSSKVSGPQFGWRKRRAVNNKFVSSLIESRRRFKTCNVGAVSEFRLAVAAQDI